MSAPSGTDPLTLGPWTPETLDLMVALSGETGESTDPIHGTYRTFRWAGPLPLVGMALHLLVLAYHDPTVDDPTRWTWLVEVWDSPDDSGRMLAQHTAHDRVGVIALLTGLLNVADHLTGALAADESQ